MPRSFTRRLFLFYAGWALLQVPAFFSQVPKTQTPQKGPGIPDGGTREVLVSIFISSLPGAPFTATVNTEWIRALPDGTRITLKNHRLIARDKSGRIFQERRLLVPEDSKQESIVTQIEISDPVLHEQYICVPRESVCQWEGFHPVEYRLGAMDRTAANSSGPPNQESLGTQSIAGLETVGARDITVIPTGAIGNDSPILSRREFWYSSQLGLNVLSIREDPRFGTQKFELSDVVLGEPDAKLFTPPEGSEILDLRAPKQVAAPGTAPHK